MRLSEIIHTSVTSISYKVITGRVLGELPRRNETPSFPFSLNLVDDTQIYKNKIKEA